jgi:hypothetical protein
MKCEFEELNETKNVKVCPICADDCVHIIKCQVNSGGVITSIDNTGTHITKGEPIGRGVVIDITYQCESMDIWIERQQFHKGYIYKLSKKVPDEPLLDIWRD